MAIKVQCIITAVIVIIRRVAENSIGQIPTWLLLLLLIILTAAQQRLHFLRSTATLSLLSTY